MTESPSYILLARRNERLRKRVAELEAALAWYADESGYRDPHAPYASPRRDPVGKDRGQRARAVLRSEDQP
jgi:hypothetical protein